MTNNIIKYFICVCVLICTNNLYAQNILEKVSKNLNSAEAIEIDFGIRRKNESETQKGNILIMKDKYVMKFMNNINYFDGKYIYNYIPDVEEVYIKASDESDMLINIYKLVNEYDKKFTAKNIGVENKDVIVELTPKSHSEEIIKLLVHINKATYLPTTIISINKSGDDTHFTIYNIDKLKKAPKSESFTFDFKNNPNVEVIDTRN